MSSKYSNTSLLVILFIVSVAALVISLTKGADKGERGISGTKGDSGINGARGVRGPKGEPGETGGPGSETIGSPRVLYLTGEATSAGWSWETDESLHPRITQTSFHTPIQGVVHLKEFTGSEAFRFFPTFNVWAGFSYTYFDDLGYTISPHLENAFDNENNFRLADGLITGDYLITIVIDELLHKSISCEYITP